MEEVFKDPNVLVDIEGKTIQVPEGYQIGKLTFMDVMMMALKWLKGTEAYAYLDRLAHKATSETLLNDLLAGDSDAVAVAIGSMVVGGALALVAMNLFIPDDGEGAQNDQKNDEPEEEPEPLRDFTIEQLREFDGHDGRKIYIGMCGDVFDCSKAVDFYGPGCGYNCFAGRDSTRAMARLSFEEEDLSNPSMEGLGPFERSTLEDWYHKFKYYKCYPIVGKVTIPPPVRDFSRAELKEYRIKIQAKKQSSDGDDNTTKALTPPKMEDMKPGERIHEPLYLGIKGRVLDVSYGGMEMYGPGGPYFCFIGADASRALAMMSLKPEDIENNDMSNLTEQQLKTLDDWEKKFIEVKKYPVVGRIVD